MIAGPAQIVRGCQTGRAGTDDSGGFSGFSGGRLIEALAVFQNIIAHIALYIADGHAFIIGTAVAVFLAEMGADPAGNHGHGIYLHDNGCGRIDISFSYLFHIGGYIRACGTFCGAGGEMGLHASKNGVIAAVALGGIAGTASLAGAHKPSAGFLGIAVKPAAHILTQIAAYGSKIADQGGSHAGRCLGEHRHVGVYLCILRNAG